ncbi:MAG: hypothetical protein M3Q24_01375 [bacterium]|nr:hypothetical protein [bacterium]
MKIYKITRGQLITAWIFTGIFILTCLANLLDYDPQVWAKLGIILVPASLVFYTLGWKQHNKNQENLIKVNTAKLASKAKKVSIALIIILLLIGVSVWAYDNQRDGGKVSGLTDIRKAEIDEYLGRFNRYTKHFDNAEQCKLDFIERNKSSYAASCKTKYDAAYATYQNCRKDMPWQDHYDCINWRGGNYEAYDCSENAIIDEIKAKEFSCFNTVNTEYAYLISFEEKLINDFLRQLPKNKATLSQEEIYELYSKLPEEVFNDKTKERFDTYIENQGYTIDE